MFPDSNIRQMHSRNGDHAGRDLNGFDGCSFKTVRAHDAKIVRKFYILQERTVAESTVAKLNKIDWEIYSCQTVASIKCKISNTGKCTWETYIC